MNYSELNTLLSEVVATLSPATSYYYSPEDQVNTLYDIVFPAVIALPWSSEIKKSTSDFTPFAYEEYEVSIAFLDQFSGTNHAHDSDNEDKLGVVAAQWRQAKQFIYELYNGDEDNFSIDVSNNTVLPYKIDPLHVYISNHVAIGVALTFKYQTKSTIDYC